MKPSAVPDEAVRAVAEALLRAYDAEFNADHLSWRDFRGQARELILAASPHIERQVLNQAADDWQAAQFPPPNRAASAFARWLRERAETRHPRPEETP
jgi:hypothetical protein